MTQAIPQNLLPNDDPDLKDCFDLYKKFLLLELNCHHVGTIQTFDPLTQTATATVNYPQSFLSPDEEGNYDVDEVPYPPMSSCPVFVIGGGSGSLTFPIKKGDECLIAFNDRDIDNWFAGIGQGGAVNTARLHSFTDAFVFVGFRSMGNVLKLYDAVNVVLQNGTSTIKLKPNGAGNLGTILQSLLTQLEALTTAVAAITVVCTAPGDPSSIPVNAPVFIAPVTGIVDQLTLIANQLQGILA